MGIKLARFAAKPTVDRIAKCAQSKVPFVSNRKMCSIYPLSRNHFPLSLALTLRLSHSLYVSRAHFALSLARHRIGLIESVIIAATWVFLEVPEFLRSLVMVSIPIVVNQLLSWI